MRMGNRELYIVPYMAIEEHGKKEHAYRIQTNCMHMNINSFFRISGAQLKSITMV